MSDRKTPQPQPYRATVTETADHKRRVEPPPMRVVEKGWWRVRETALPTQEVERQNDERQQQG